MTPEPPFETFLVDVIDVRDLAIDAARHLTTGQNETVGSRWSETLRGVGADEVRNVLIPDVVDETIATFLRAIDSGTFELHVRDRQQHGALVSLRDLGSSRLADDYLDDEEGWRAVYSHRPAHPFGRTAATAAASPLAADELANPSPAPQPPGPRPELGRRLAEPPPEGRRRELWLQHVAGLTLLDGVRSYAVGRLDESLTDRERAHAIAAVDDALYGLMMLIDGIPQTIRRDDLCVDLGFTVRLRRGREIETELDLRDEGDGMCIGYHGWLTGDFGDDPVVEGA